MTATSSFFMQMSPVLLLLLLFFTSAFSFHSSIVPKRIHSRSIRTSLHSVIDRCVTDSKESVISAQTDVFIDNFQKALQGDTESLFSSLTPDCVWKNPLTKNINQFKEELTDLSKNIMEPVVVCYEKNEVSATEMTIRYQIALTYPLSWLPRVLIPGTAVIKYSDDLKYITSVDEKWDVSVLDLIFKQLTPRWWDIFHLFSSPTPEYPPVKTIGQIDGVKFLELPQTLAVEVIWHGLAKYPGPSLRTIPGFALFGSLKTFKPNRETYYTVLPVEVKSAKYTDKNTGEEMKMSSWLLNIPTVAQNNVFQNKTLNVYSSLDEYISESLPEQEQKYDEVDFQVGYEQYESYTNTSVSTMSDDVMLEGIDMDSFMEFIGGQSIGCKYHIVPKRVIAQINMLGNVKTDNIQESFRRIRTVISKNQKAVEKLLNRPVKGLASSIPLNSLPSERIDKNISPSDLSIPTKTPILGLQLWSCKGCFNIKGEPAMAVYEIQYNLKRTSVFTEIEFAD